MTDRFEKKKRIKLMLLAGKKLTVRFMDQHFSVNNSAQIINVLRKEGMDIKMTWKQNRETGNRFGEYSYVAPKKESRITNQTYR